MPQFVLLLNDMRSAKIEYRERVVRGDSIAQLKALIAHEKDHHGYRDGKWGKSFRKGGPLEWYNGIFEFEKDSHFDLAGWEGDDDLPHVRDFMDVEPCDTAEGDPLPIETAPHNGLIVLVNDTNEDAQAPWCIANYNPFMQRWVYTHGSISGTPNPTHWLPLPELPR